MVAYRDHKSGDLPTIWCVSEAIVNQHEDAQWNHLSAQLNPTRLVLEGRETVLLADNLPTPTKEISQQRYQVGMKTQIYGLGYDNSVVYIIKDLSNVYKKQ